MDIKNTIFNQQLINRSQREVRTKLIEQMDIALKNQEAAHVTINGVMCFDQQLVSILRDYFQRENEMYVK